MISGYELMQPTYISNIGLYHTMYSRYIFMKCSIILAQIHILLNVEMKIISIKVTVRNAVLCMGTMDSCPVVVSIPRKIIYLYVYISDITQTVRYRTPVFTQPFLWRLHITITYSGDFFFYFWHSLRDCQLLSTSGRKDFNLIIRKIVYSMRMPMLL
jgi:hypothetical protein